MADIRYSSKVKELSDAVYFPMDATPEEKVVMIKILDRLIDND